MVPGANKLRSRARQLAAFLGAAALLGLSLGVAHAHAADGGAQSSLDSPCVVCSTGGANPAAVPNAPPALAQLAPVLAQLPARACERARAATATAPRERSPPLSA